VVHALRQLTHVSATAAVLCASCVGRCFVALFLLCSLVANPRPWQGLTDLSMMRQGNAVVTLGILFCIQFLMGRRSGAGFCCELLQSPHFGFFFNQGSCSACLLGVVSAGFVLERASVEV
jgi:hypothetical protein